MTHNPLDSVLAVRPEVQFASDFDFGDLHYGGRIGFRGGFLGVNAIGLPAPFLMIARGVLIIMAVIVTIYLLLGMLGTLPPLHRLP